MKITWRSVAVVPVLGIALVLSSCSGDQSGLITGPSDSLNRGINTPFAFADPPLQSCEVKALDYFGNGGGLPFEVSCEDMGDASVQVLSEDYSEGGCMIGVLGVVSFPTTTGNEYRFTATARDCQHDGGMLKICSTQLGGCVEVALPHLQIVDPGHVRSSAN